MWIWIAVDRLRRKFIDFEALCRGLKTGKLLWDRIKTLDPQYIMTDHWRPYDKMIDSGIHIKSKAQTYTVEGYNGVIRGVLKRLNRKTKCYTKCIQMLKLSLRMVMIDWNESRIT